MRGAARVNVRYARARLQAATVASDIGAAAIASLILSMFVAPIDKAVVRSAAGVKASS